MGIYSFTQNIFKSEKKENIIYTGVIIVISICLFNIINMIYNSKIYPDSGSVERIQEGGAYYATSVVELSVEYVVKENILALLIFATTIVILNNWAFIKKKSKAIAFMIYSGGTFVDALRFLCYTNFKSCFGGSVLGCLLGLILSPIFNIIIYFIMGVDAPILFFDFEVVIVSLIYCILIFVIVCMINMGYVYRKDIMGLLKGEDDKRLDDKRSIKMPFYLVFLVILAPFIYALTFPNYKGADGGAYVMTILSLIGILGLKYIKDDLIKFLKKGDYLFKKRRLIYWCNGLSDLKDLTVYIIMFVLSVTLLLKAGMEVYSFDGMKENVLIVIGLMYLIICTGVIYKLMLKSEDILKRSRSLNLLGYSKDEVLEAVIKELILVFAFLIGIPTVIISSNIFIYVLAGTCSVFYGITLLAITIIPTTISLILVVTLNIKIIKNELYKDYSEIKSVENFIVEEGF